MNQVLLTKEAIKKLEEKKQKLLLERPNAVKELARAREMGDLSENGFYKGARFKLSQIDRELRNTTYLLKNAKLIEKSGKEEISVGNSVVIEESGRDFVFTIVGEEEANPKEKKISYLSPTGRGLIGKKVGEIAEIFTPSGKVSYKIKEIK